VEDVLAKTFEAAIAAGLPVRFEIAGPVLEEAVQTRLNELLATHSGRVLYHGPVYGRAKDAFYDRVDVFLFPTKWKQEAQPNVIYEAFAGGAAVVAFARGCIPDMIPSDFGLVVDREADFASLASDWLTGYWNTTYRPVVQKQITAYSRGERETSLRQNEKLLELLEL